MQRPVFAANWKMNHGPTQARAFMAAFTARWTPHADRTVVFFPPALSVTSVVHALGSRTDLGVGVQNIWTEDKGAFTGESSAPIAKEAGARYALVGHSERRHVFGETDEQTALKCGAATRAGLIPVLCVGELLAEREAGQTEQVLKTQVTGAFAGITAEAAAPIVIAYEPVWAIGTGKTATPEMAVEAHRIVRSEVAKLLGNDVASKMRILYGGSVKPDNATALCGQEEIDGALVGGASLKPDSFTAIVKY